MSGAKILQLPDSSGSASRRETAGIGVGRHRYTLGGSGMGVVAEVGIKEGSNAGRPSSGHLCLHRSG